MAAVTSILLRILAGSQFTGTNGGATGSITTVAGALINQGEKFFLRDGLRPEMSFLFDKSGLLVSDGLNRVVQITNAMTADDVRDAIVLEINRSPLNIAAKNGGAATVGLRNVIPGAAGNKTPSADTVVDAGFIVSSMTGGVAAPRSFTEGGVQEFDPAAFGGLYGFSWCGRRFDADGVPAVTNPVSWVIDRIIMDTTTAVSYDVRLLMRDDTEVSLATAAGGLVTLGPYTLAGDEQIKLVTAGATGAMWAKFTARPKAN